jgi:hypothetical protein
VARRILWASLALAPVAFIARYGFHLSATALFVLAAVLARDRGRSAAWSGLLSIGESALLAAVLVLMTRHAEGKLLSRPPKSLLGWQLGAFVSMAIWETGLSLLHPSADWLGDTHFLIGHALAGISFLLVAGWLVGTKLMLAGIEDDQAS